MSCLRVNKESGLFNTTIVATAAKILRTSILNLKVIPDTEFLAKPPLVSVHMITYNRALYIRQAIDGVLAQNTTFPIELVIGEDCSTDGTREIVFEYQRQHPDLIRLVVSDSNVGASDNSRRSLALCRGKYIAFCEGDDYWTDSYKLQKQADFLGSESRLLTCPQ